MSERPEVLFLHTVYGSRGHDADAERAAIEAELGIDVRAARTPAESREKVRTADVVVSAASGIPGELLDAAERLRWVQAVSSGVDAYPRERLREAGVALTNAAGINAEPIAEQVLGYLLCFERRLPQGLRQQEARTWERFEGGELRGKTIGLVGVGEVGGRVADLASAFGMRVLGVKRHPETAPDTVESAVGPDALAGVLAESDYVVLACPLTEETRGMIGAGELEAMKQSGVLVNVARGPVADYDALTEALQQHVIAGAALDVYPEEPFPADSPLWGLSNTIMTPHMAGSTPRKPERLAEIFAANYAAFVDGDDAMPTRVD